MTREIQLKAEGIICSGCAMDMEAVLSMKIGIKKATVNFADGTVLISYDPEELNDEMVHQIVDNLGFKSKIIKAWNTI